MRERRNHLENQKRVLNVAWEHYMACAQSDPHTAEDDVQRAYEKIFRKLPSRPGYCCDHTTMQPSTLAARGLMRRVIKSSRIDRERRERTHRTTSLDAPTRADMDAYERTALGESTIDEYVPAHQEAQRVLAEIKATVPGADRALVFLGEHSVEGYSEKEIARRHGVSHAVVRKSISRLRHGVELRDNARDPPSRGRRIQGSGMRSRFSRMDRPLGRGSARWSRSEAARLPPSGRIASSCRGRAAPRAGDDAGSALCATPAGTGRCVTTSSPVAMRGHGWRPSVPRWRALSSGGFPLPLESRIPTRALCEAAVHAQAPETQPSDYPPLLLQLHERQPRHRGPRVTEFSESDE